MNTQKLKQSFALYTKYFLIQQTYIQDMYYKRIPLRQKHEQLLDKMAKQGAQIIGGGLFPFEGAYYIVNANDNSLVQNFIENDPYTKENLAKTSFEEIQMEHDIFDQLSHQFSYK